MNAGLFQERKKKGVKKIRQIKKQHCRRSEVRRKGKVIKELQKQKEIKEMGKRKGGTSNLWIEAE